jgi:hypothetical protein
MSSAYYSDRARGPRARSEEQVDETLWEAIQALFARGVDTALFAQDFPIGCEDGKGVYACDRDGLVATVRAEIPDLGYHFYQRGLPPTLAILDFLELMYRHASQPSERDYHSYFQHHHLRFDRAAGRRELRETVNRLLARSGSVYELDERGRIQRLVPSPVHDLLALELPPTHDADFDRLLATSACKHLDPDPAVRADGLEKLWDAFERIKTILDQDKRKGANQLVEAATDGATPAEAEMLRSEMKTLTDVGNDFRIRHHETRVSELTTASSDQLFVRMYALLIRLHPALRWCVSITRR